MVVALALLSRTMRSANGGPAPCRSEAQGNPGRKHRSRLLRLPLWAIVLGLAAHAAAAGPAQQSPRPPESDLPVTLLPPAQPPVEIAGGIVPALPAADNELAAPGELAASHAADLAGAPGATAGGTSADFGVEYQLSREAAASWLDRVGSWLKGVVHDAMAWLGTPYRIGGASRHGIDCSGLTGAVFAHHGIDLPRTAAEQFALGLPVAVENMRPGDLVFFRNTYKRGISHVGIYIGEGHFIHAAGRKQGVIVSELARPYYQLRFAGARRVATSPEESRPSLAAGAPSTPASPASARSDAASAPAAAPASAPAGGR